MLLFQGSMNIGNQDLGSFENADWKLLVNFLYDFFKYQFSPEIVRHPWTIRNYRLRFSVEPELSR